MFTNKQLGFELSLAWARWAGSFLGRAAFAGSRFPGLGSTHSERPSGPAAPPSLPTFLLSSGENSRELGLDGADCTGCGSALAFLVHKTINKLLLYPNKNYQYLIQGVFVSNQVFFASVRSGGSSQVFFMTLNRNSMMNW